jgi:hypothetical protein
VNRSVGDQLRAIAAKRVVRSADRVAPKHRRRFEPAGDGEYEGGTIRKVLILDLDMVICRRES